MKKLIVAAVAIAMAVVANAAQIKWSASYGIADGTESGSNAATMAYLINSAELTQTEIYTALLGGASLSDAVAGKTVASAALSEGAMDPQTLDVGYAANTYQKMYMVCFDDSLNAVYFSEELDKKMLGTGAQKYAFSADSSVAGIAADMTGFSAADGGWVQTVPEPTSGLLMLLGMAGLALRRRRA